MHSHPDSCDSFRQLVDLLVDLVLITLVPRPLLVPHRTSSRTSLRPHDLLHEYRRIPRDQQAKARGEDEEQEPLDPLSPGVWHHRLVAELALPLELADLKVSQSGVFWSLEDVGGDEGTRGGIDGDEGGGLGGWADEGEEVGVERKGEVGFLDETGWWD